MGWRGAGGSGSASIGWYFFAGGLLMVLGGLGEVCSLCPLFPFISSLTTPIVDSRQHQPLRGIHVLWCLLAWLRRYHCSYLRSVRELPQPQQARQHWSGVRWLQRRHW